MNIEEQLRRETAARIALFFAYCHAKKAALLAAFLVGFACGASLFSIFL